MHARRETIAASDACHAASPQGCSEVGAQLRHGWTCTLPLAASLRRQAPDATDGAGARTDTTDNAHSPGESWACLSRLPLFLSLRLQVDAGAMKASAGESERSHGRDRWGEGRAVRTARQTQSPRARTLPCAIDPDSIVQQPITDFPFGATRRRSRVRRVRSRIVGPPTAPSSPAGSRNSILSCAPGFWRAWSARCAIVPQRNCSAARSASAKRSTSSSKPALKPMTSRAGSSAGSCRPSMLSVGHFYAASRFAVSRDKNRYRTTRFGCGPASGRRSSWRSKRTSDAFSKAARSGSSAGQRPWSS
jgi:hypothetical protein